MVEELTFKEFEDMYCQDILLGSKSAEQLLQDDDMFPADEIVTDPDTGKPIKMLRDAADNLIPIEDIMTHDESDFIRLHPAPESLECYTAFRKNFEFAYAEEVILNAFIAFKKAHEEAEHLAQGHVESLFGGANNLCL